MRLASRSITAQPASNKVGAANVAATQQVMGNAYGVSAVPQRPHDSFCPAAGARTPLID